MDDNRQNEIIYDLYRDRSAEEVREYATSTWDGLKAAVEACAEDDLSRPHPYAANEVLWQTALGLPYHTGEHLTYWFHDAGDETQVEAAQRWLRDLYTMVAPDARNRANANYNLACYFARNGRADEALPLLRESLEGNEQLHEWARKDSDLDPIRDDPRLNELLA